MSGTKNAENIHAGHRERVKDSVLKNGYQQLENHRVLELLLFYSIPREDTNETAHRLLSEFGSLSGIFKASPEELQRVPGVGKNTAIMLSTVSEIMSRAAVEKPLKKKNYKSFEDLKELASSLFINESKEVVRLLCFDSAMRPKQFFELSTGDETSADFDVSEIVKDVMLCEASAAVLVHNHPTSDCTPSVNDVDATRVVAVMLRKLGHSLADHLIVGEDGEVYSMFRDQRFKPLFY